MKIKDLAQKTQEELKKSLRENREKLRQMRFDLTLRKIKNVKQAQAIKKDVARMLTVLNNKEKGAK